MTPDFKIVEIVDTDQDRNMLIAQEIRGYGKKIPSWCSYERFRAIMTPVGEIDND